MRFHYFRSVRMLCFIVAVLLPLLAQNESLAAFGEDTEKPVPEFTRVGKTITAKLIPRAKSTSVLIDFNVSKGNLADVKAIEFETIRTPELDIKEFKSSFFDVAIDSVTPGSDVEIIISSPFFAVSTEYWIYNSKKSTKWFNSGVKAEKGVDSANQFAIRVKDGGELDCDSMANGRIQLTGGPKDYFWSYALGTLVVRFFGVLLVLSILMIGMQAAGQFFISLEKRRNRRTPPLTQTPKQAPVLRTEPVNLPDETSTPDTDTVVAIAMALHKHLSHRRSPAVDARKTGQNSWTHYGRVEIQNARVQTFKRPVNPEKHF